MSNLQTLPGFGLATDGPIVIGTDPGGSAPLRVDGGARFTDDVALGNGQWFSATRNTGALVVPLLGFKAGTDLVVLGDEASLPNLELAAAHVLIGGTADNGTPATLQNYSGGIWANGGVLAQYARMGVSTANAQLVFDGDSLTFGTGGTAPYSNSVTLTDSGVTYTKTNVAVTGRTAAQLTDTGFALVDALHNVYARNIVVVWAGTNDLIGGASTGLTVANIRAYCRARQKAGARVVVCTLTSINGQETNRETVNTIIRAHWTEFADALADLGANANIGAHNAYLSSTYFNVDGIHLKDAGYAVVATLVQAAANAMLAGSRWINQLDVIGTLVAELGIQVTGGSATPGSMFKDAGTGLTLVGVTGGGSDFRIVRPDGTTVVLAVPPGTSDLVGTGSLTTGAPTGGAGAWKYGIANTVSPTAPNRTVTIQIGATTYYLAAKTTND
jgi:lysophospholipase L1-like esterase